MVYANLVTGTSWIGQVLRLMFNKDTSTELHKVIPNMDFGFPDEPTSLEMLSDMTSPRIMISHLRPSFFGEAIKKSSSRFIVGMRNPKDVAVSYFNFHRALSVLGKFSGTFDEFFSLFIKGDVVYGDYFEHVAAWWKFKDDPRFLFLFFEDMKKDPFKANTDISDFLKLDLTEERLREITEKTTFKVMKDDKTVNFENAPASNYDSGVTKYLRKGEVGDWVNTLKDEQSKAIDEKCKAILEPLGIKFDFQI